MFGNLDDFPFYFYKMEGETLLKLNKEENAIKCFEEYRKLLLKKKLDNEEFLLFSLNSQSSEKEEKNISTNEEANILNEISSVALKEKKYDIGTNKYIKYINLNNFIIAIKYSLKAIKKDKTLIQAYRTLVWSRFFFLLLFLKKILVYILE